MQLTVFILAAESGAKHERWANYMETPKQFINVRGEALIGRTVRLCQEHGEHATYILTLGALFDALPVNKLVPTCFATKAHSVLSVLNAWQGGDLVVLYSDVYYSDAVFGRVMNTAGTHFFGRSGRSAFTFKNYGELFAVRIAWHDKARFSDVLNQCVADYECTGQQSFWALYRRMAGLPNDGHYVESTLFIEVHDETDDIDFPHDVQRVTEAVEKRVDWRMRFLARRLSLWNKRRRDRFRALRRSP
ncbi:hypothetical protein [Atopomonas sediminilitoris]|uniref:hypothetical protein n=1 Tax=Atopomonas sediminilitoris TaxID=2919919 RepID=UPI001F4E7ECC|nr:hypothetical protein [Atopomonas sediminilitoris]MCJ8168959.1 hypothetical protein [Atopomonas sediminilitoris]